MNAAVIQMGSGRDKEKNLATALGLVEKAIHRGADFVALPEVFGFRGKPDPQRGFYNYAEKIPGSSTAPFMDLAKKYRVTILAGTVCEYGPDSYKVYNTSVMIGNDGRILAKYRKKHLFDAVLGQTKIIESKNFSAGKRGRIAQIGPWRVGMSICYDLRFPEFYRRYARRGVDLICVPSAFTRATGVAHWETLLRARAIENLSYVLAPNQVGPDARGVSSYGHSMIVDPWGTVLARASGSKPQILLMNLDRRKLCQVRNMLPDRKIK